MPDTSSFTSSALPDFVDGFDRSFAPFEEALPRITDENLVFRE
jgi:hypothetical protein